MRALIGYQAGILLRSHRWLPPLLVYLAGVIFLSNGQPLSAGLSWSGAMLMPAVAWLTRSGLTAEPAAARACAAAAAGPHRAHLAALAAALAAGIILALAGTGYELVTCRPPAGGLPARAAVTAAGLVTAVICACVGSAIGALCNPPVIRRVGLAILATAGGVIAGLVAGISPANAAIRQAGGVSHAQPAWPSGLPLAAALVLLAAAWAVSVLLAARRGDPAPDGW